MQIEKEYKGYKYFIKSNVFNNKLLMGYCNELKLETHTTWWFYERLGWNRADNKMRNKIDLYLELKGELNDNQI